MSDMSSMLCIVLYRDGSSVCCSCRSC